MSSSPQKRYVNAVDAPQRKAMYELGMGYYHTGAYSKVTEMLLPM